MMKTFILGSSHVTRLANYLTRTGELNLGDYEVKIQGVNGGLVTDMYRYLVDIYDFGPHSVFLQIGSNDIGNSETSVENVYLAIECFVDALLTLNVKHVFIGLLFNRNKVVPKRGLSVYQYNERVALLNEYLYYSSIKQQHLMTFWRHRGLQFPSCSILDQYGVHLNDEGNRRLVSSVRGALLFAKRVVQGNYSF